MTTRIRVGRGFRGAGAGFLVLVWMAGAWCSPALGNSIVGGFPMPSLDDEKSTYRRWGWTWSAAQEPAAVFPSSEGFTVSNPDVHGDTEGDDLWLYVIQWWRTGVRGYLNRAKAWARYLRDEYRQCIGGDYYRTYCFDREGHELDHVYANGLLTYYELTGDASYLAAAEAICSDIETIWMVNRASAQPGSFRMGTVFSMRGYGRQLLALARCYEKNPSRWRTVFQRLTDLWVQSPDFEFKGPSGGGMFFLGQSQTDYVAGAGAYASGLRIQGSFHIGILAEAFFHTYRVTGRSDVRDKIVQIARYVKDFGLNPVTRHTGTWYGVTGSGQAWQSSEGAAYTISQVNALVFGSWFTTGSESAALLERAKAHFNRGTKYACCPATGQRTPDNQVDHFLDTETDSATGHFYMGHNKGELQYAWAIFVPPDSRMAAAARSIAPGQWAEIPSPTNIGYVLGATGSSGHRLTYATNAVWDPGLRRIYFCGSDHPEAGRCMYYDDGTNSWTLMASPPWASGVQHGYDHTAIDPIRRYLYHRPFGGTEVWRCRIADPSSCESTWTNAGTLAALRADCCIGTEFVTWRGGAAEGAWMFFQAVSGSSAQFQQWDPGTGNVSPVGSPVAPGSGSFLECTAGSPHVCYAGSDGSDLHVLRASGGVMTAATPPCSTYEQSSVSAVDPVTGKLIQFCPAGVYEFDPGTNVWRQVSGAAPPQQFVSLWSNGAVAVSVPSYGVIVVIGANAGTSDATKKMWVYKHAELLPREPMGGPPPGGNTPPGAPRGLRAL